MAQAKTFRKYFADLVSKMQDPTSLACELYSKGIIPFPVLEVACNHVHERSLRAVKVAAAVEAQIKGNWRVFDEFLGVLGKDLSMSELCKEMTKACGKNCRAKNVLPPN